VRFNTDGLLRTNLKERYESYRIAAEIEEITGEPLLTVPEMRELENRSRVDSEGVAGGVSAPETGARSLSVAEVVQKVYLGVGKVINADEARRIINDAGGDLDPNRPVAPVQQGSNQ